MESFYQNLHDGSDKSSALHDAKISYMENDFTDQNSAHPYYWSAYALLGNAAPIDMRIVVNWWIWLIGIGLIFIIFSYFFKRKKA